MSEILIQNVSKTYPTKDGNVQALKNVNLSIEQGDIYGIIGMSGAGKSTLVRCINYLEEPTEGKVFIKGKELGSFSRIIGNKSEKTLTKKLIARGYISE